MTGKETFYKQAHGLVTVERYSYSLELRKHFQKVRRLSLCIDGVQVGSHSLLNTLACDLQTGWSGICPPQAWTCQTCEALETPFEILAGPCCFEELRVETPFENSGYPSQAPLEALLKPPSALLKPP